MAITEQLVKWGIKNPNAYLPGSDITFSELETAAGAPGRGVSALVFRSQMPGIVQDYESTFQDLLKMRTKPVLPEIPSDSGDMARRRTRLDEQRRRGRISTILSGQYAQSGMPTILGGQTLLGGK